MSADKPNDLALWRFQIISPLLSIDGPRGALKRAIESISRRTHDHPHKGTIQIGYGTVEDWLYQYRKDGFDGLIDRRRRDQGRSRAIDEAVAEKITALAKDRPQLDGPGILAELKANLKADKDEDPEQKPISLPSLSSLYRFLRARGLDQRGKPNRTDHRAFAFDLAGDCWQGDVMFGPTLAVKDGSRRKTYLIAILDDASRLIVHAQFYFEQHLRSLKDCLKQALLKRGLPRRFYFDNGQIFRSRLLLQLTARLGIQLIHTRPYKPQGRAKMERWFLTVRKTFLARIDFNTVTDIDHFNRLLFAWIEGDYHQSPHRGIDKETPLDRWMRLSEGIRQLPGNLDVDELFLEEATRRVSKDGTLSLKSKSFEAGPRFIGQKVKVLFDPFDLRKLVLIDNEDRREFIYPVNLAGNRYVQRESEVETESKGEVELTSLEQLAEELDQQETDTEGQNDE
jgi:putative transposase